MQTKATKARFIPLFITQFVGVLNDNFLKNSIIFVSMFWLAEGDRGMVIPVASALLVIPFVLFSPLAGRMAQTHSKQKIFEYAKLAEVPIMILAVLGFYIKSMEVVMAAMLLMGLQSAIYAPSKFGLIRDVGGVEGLSFGVGTMELLMFLGVLLGQLFAGVVSDLTAGMTHTLSTVLLALAVIGWMASRSIRVEEESADEEVEDSAFPHIFLYQTAKWARSVKGLNTTIIGLGAFWFVAALLQMNIYDHVPRVYGLSNTGTAVIMALLSIGIGLGCGIAGVLSKNRVELGMAPLGGVGMSIVLTVFATTRLNLYAFVGLLFMAAFFIGFYKVPLSAWIQERVKGRKLGKALAYNQLMGFLFILMAAFAFWLCTHFSDTYTVFITLAVVSWLMTLMTIVNIPAMMLRFVVFILTKLYFRLEIKGIENIPRQTGAIMVANHISLLDSFIIAATVPRMVRFVMDRKIYEHPLANWLLKRLNMVPVSTKMGKEQLDEFNRLCQEEVNNNHVLCIFPEGQVSRTGHLLEFKKGIEHIAANALAPIIPVHLGGLRNTPLSYRVGESKPVAFGRRGFKKQILVNIGEQVPADSPAFVLRQEIQGLNASSLDMLIPGPRELVNRLKKKTEKYGNRIFMIEEDGRKVSFKGFMKQALQCAKHWEISGDEKVGLYGVETIDYCISAASVLLAGKTPVFLPGWLTKEERVKVLSDHGIRTVVGDKFDTPGDLKFIGTEGFVKEHSKGRTARASMEDAGPAGVFFFSEHNGSLRENVLTHKAIAATIDGLTGIFKVPEECRVYSDLPLSSSWGFVQNCWLPLYIGTAVRLGKTGGDEIETIKDMVVSESINTLFINASVVEGLVDHLTADQWKKLEYVVMGRQDISEEIREKLQGMGVTPYRSMGFHLCGVVAAVNSPDHSVAGITGRMLEQHGTKPGSFGRPVPGLAVRAVSPDDYDQRMGPGEEGMLLAKGPGVVEEGVLPGTTYHNGWLVTGEFGSIDKEGFLYISR